MRILTVLLGITAATWTAATASPPACNRGKLAECQYKVKDQISQVHDFSQLTLEGGKEICKQYATFRDCMGGTENLQECTLNGLPGFGTSDIEETCNDEDTLKAWVCVAQQSRDVTAGFSDINQAGATCEEATRFKYETITSLTQKCGEKVREIIEKQLDNFIEQKRFCP